MNRLPVLLFLTIALTTNIAVSATKKFSLTTAEKNYKNVLAKINTSYTTTIRNTSAKYSKTIHGFRITSKRAGDLEKTLAAQKEEKRFSRENSVPEEPPIDLPSELVLAQINYTKALAKAKVDKYKNIIDLAKRFTNYLDTIKRRMVAADKIEQAIKIQAAIKKVGSSPVVTAAQFALADNTSTDDPQKTQPPNGDKTPADQKFETFKYTKSIRSKGNMSYNWTATTLRLKKGDVVTVKAVGSWVCTWHTRACDPDGYPAAHYNASKIKKDATYNYGALILKCGGKGDIILVGKGTTFTSEKGGVLVYLDSNVLPSRTHRKGCGGNMKVTFTINRKKE